jgi:hypothetical protein
MSSVRDTLDALNSAWRNKRFDELETYLDEHFVMRSCCAARRRVRRATLIS